MIIKYATIHLVELALVFGILNLVRHFLDISTWLMIAIMALWIIKDIFLLPKVWKAYACVNDSPMSRLIGLEATAIDSLDPFGYVRIEGELWKAEIGDPRYPARKGDRTRVVDTEGMTLIVERCNDR